VAPKNDHQGLSLIFPNNWFLEIKKIGWVMTLTLLHSKIFDVGDLPVLTCGNCVLKTGVIKWPLNCKKRVKVDHTRLPSVGFRS